MFARRKKRYNALMVARLIVIFFIVICLEAGISLIIVPWLSFWGDNYLLALVTAKTGMPVLEKAIASGWMRGAVTGLGVLNLLIAFWEMLNFKHNVRMLEGKHIEPSAVRKK